MLPEYLQPGMECGAAPSCRDCGAAPAMHARFHHIVGLIVAWKNKRRERVLCRDCAITLGTNTQGDTMRTGWWSIWSPIVNTLALYKNRRELRRLREAPRAERPEVDARFASEH
jgi:hypothetical protein